MRRFFQHNLFIYLLALFALILAITSFAWPKIRGHNSSVEPKQIESRIEANGQVDNERGYLIADGIHYSANPHYYAEIATPLALFISLLLTNRIGYSLFSVMLFRFQFELLFQLYLSNVKFPMSYFYNTRYRHLYL